MAKIYDYCQSLLESLKLAYEVAFKTESLHKRQTPEERYETVQGVFELAEMNLDFIKQTLELKGREDMKIYDIVVGVTNLVAGTATVESANIPANARFFFSHRSIGGVPGFLQCQVAEDNNSFTLTSTSSEDESIVDWFYIVPSEEQNH